MCVCKETHLCIRWAYKWGEELKSEGALTWDFRGIIIAKEQPREDASLRGGRTNRAVCDCSRGRKNLESINVT